MRKLILKLKSCSENLFFGSKSYSGIEKPILESKNLSFKAKSYLEKLFWNDKSYLEKLVCEPKSYSGKLIWEPKTYSRKLFFRIKSVQTVTDSRSCWSDTVSDPSPTMNPRATSRSCPCTKNKARGSDTKQTSYSREGPYV